MQSVGEIIASGKTVLGDRYKGVRQDHYDIFVKGMSEKGRLCSLVSVERNGEEVFRGHRIFDGGEIKLRNEVIPVLPRPRDSMQAELYSVVWGLTLVKGLFTAKVYTNMDIIRHWLQTMDCPSHYENLFKYVRRIMDGVRCNGMVRMSYEWIEKGSGSKVDSLWDEGLSLICPEYVELKSRRRR